MTNHGGQRKGAGRKPAPNPVFIKKFRASEAERNEFMSLLTGNAREDFVLILRSLRSSRLPTLRGTDEKNTRRTR
jgi:hypothetical protein